MTRFVYDDELLARLMRQLFEFAKTHYALGTIEEFRDANPQQWHDCIVECITFLDIIRAYDREQRDKLNASLAARSEFQPQPVTDFDVEMGQKEFAAALADQRADPDDYRDLPVAMTEAVAFSGGLTTDKRK